MIHIRVDDSDRNSERRFACGIGPELPEGDKYFFASELRSERADCPVCNPAGPRRIGTPLTELSGQPGKPGYAKFVEIAKSWGHE